MLPAFQRIAKMSAISLIFLTVLTALVGTDLPAARSQTGSKDRNELKINFVASEPCSLLAFLDALSGRRHTTFWIADWYWKKRESAKKAADNEMLAKYKNLMEGGGQSYADAFADDSGRNLNLDQKLLSVAAECNNVDELLSKSKSLISEEHFESLKSVLQYFAPVYDTLVWQPQLPTLQRQLGEYRAEAIRVKMGECLTAVKHFMRSPWPADLPFVIVLVPLPTSGKGTHGESMGRVQIVELMPDSPFRKDADVVFHEACHALWFSKKDLVEADKLFVTADGRKLPTTELYEGMATALGQGCFSTEAFGRTPKSWYADATIAAYAREVFPLYADYLNSEKQIDPEFCRRAAERYFKLFPSVDRPIKETEAYLVLADKVSDLTKFKADIYRAMPRLREMSVCAPVDAGESLNTFRNYRESEGKHMAVLISADNLYKTVELNLSMEQVEKLGRKPGVSTVSAGGKEILFCVAPTEAAQVKLFFDYLKRGKWGE